MMNMDMARAGDPPVKFSSVKKTKQDSSKTGGVTTNPGVGPTEPVFESKESKLNIEIPSGWRTVES